MVVNDLDIRRTRRPIWPLEADPPLQVYTDAPLAFAATLQRLKPIARQSAQVSKAGGRIKYPETLAGLLPESAECRNISAETERFTPAVAKTPDHPVSLVVMTRDVKRSQ